MKKPYIKESECYCDCETCSKRIDIGDDFRYETKGYRTFCSKVDCFDGWATEGSVLEYCWFGENDDIEWEDGVVK